MLQRLLDPPVAVLEPHDVLEVRRGDLENRRVLERAHAVHRSGHEVERGARPDDLAAQDGLAERAHLDHRAPGLHEPRLVLHAVELERELLTGADEERLAHVVLAVRPQQLVSPWLVYAARLERKSLEPFWIWGEPFVGCHWGECIPRRERGAW